MKNRNKINPKTVAILSTTVKSSHDTILKVKELAKILADYPTIIRLPLISQNEQIIYDIILKRAQLGSTDSVIDHIFLNHLGQVTHRATKYATDIVGDTWYNLSLQNRSIILRQIGALLDYRFGYKHNSKFHKKQPEIVVIIDENDKHRLPLIDPVDISKELIEKNIVCVGSTIFDLDSLDELKDFLRNEK